jgi:hypothetical protein
MFQNLLVATHQAHELGANDEISWIWLFFKLRDIDKAYLYLIGVTTEKYKVSPGGTVMTNPQV